MKIYKFLDKTWDEIPDEDNPFKLYLKNKEQCIMIYKTKYEGLPDD